MDLTPNKRANKYDRVMSRVQNISRSTLKSPSLVTRHEIPSSVSVGAKPSGSNVSSSLFSELPVVLNDYSPEVPPQRKFVVKPRKTIRSLNPATSPHRPLPVPRTIGQPVPKIRTRGSAPVVTNRHSENWSDSHLRQCYSSRSHCKLKELKDEIKAYRETDRQMKLRSKLYKSCGVILDDVGQVAADKAVQVQVPEVAEADKEQYSASQKAAVTAANKPAKQQLDRATKEGNKQRPVSKGMQPAPRKQDAGCDDDGFTTVEKKKKASRRNLCGTAPTGHNHLLRPAIPTTLVYVSRLHYSTKPEDIVEYMRVKTKFTLRVERLESRHNVNFNSFVVRVPTDHLSTFMKEDFWPKGVLFRRFRGRLPDTALRNTSPSTLRVNK